MDISTWLSPQALQAPKAQDPSGPKDAPCLPVIPEPTHSDTQQGIWEKTHFLSGEPGPAPLPLRSVSHQPCLNSHSYCTTLASASSHCRDRTCLLTGFSASRPAIRQAVPVHTQWFCSRTKTGASCFSWLPTWSRMGSVTCTCTAARDVASLGSTSPAHSVPITPNYWANLDGSDSAPACAACSPPGTLCPAPPSKTRFSRTQHRHCGPPAGSPPQQA